MFTWVPPTRRVQGSGSPPRKPVLSQWPPFQQMEPSHNHVNQSQGPPRPSLLHAVSAVPHRLCQCNFQIPLRLSTPLPPCHMPFPWPTGTNSQMVSCLHSGSLQSALQPTARGHFHCTHWIIPLLPINTLPLLLRGPSWSTRSHTVRPGAPLLPERPFQTMLQPHSSSVS